jgi:Fe-S cluster assembly iron-binding protein IscA
MLTVSDDAKAHLASIMSENNVPDEQSIRLVAGAQGLGLAPDTPGASDDTYEHDGKTVLCVEPALNKQLEGRTMTIEQSEQGARLNIA